MDPFDAARKIIVERTQVVMAAIGAETRDEIKESISTPYPPASDPYSPPHARTRRLHNGVSHEQTVLPDRVRETISSVRVPGDPRVPEYLTEGTPKMAPRPYMKPEKVAETILDRVAAKIRF